MHSQPAWRTLLGAILVVTIADGLAAQVEATVTAEHEWFYDSPNGKRLARLLPGATLTAGRIDGDWQEVTLEGWIFTPSVEITARSGFDLRVSRRPEENLRTLPNQRILARLATGFLLERRGGNDNWTQVRRVGWVPRSALYVMSESDAQGRLASRDPVMAISQTEVRTALRTRPEVSSDSVGVLGDSTTVQIVERRDDWVRVHVDGWVRESDLVPSGGILRDVTAQDLQDNPDLYLGKLIRWRLQFVALQTADELRPEIPEGWKYMLTRGPLPDAGFVYVVIPPARLAEVEDLRQLSTIVVVGRVRAARARFINNPVLDLIELVETPGS